MLDQTRIIVIEDVLFIREALWQIFSGTEIKILCFTSSGDELMSQVKKQKPDIVLLDLVLPNENGITLIKKIHFMYPEMKTIAISSLNDENVLINAFRCGASDFVQKPFSSEEILHSIREVKVQQVTNVQKLAA